MKSFAFCILILLPLLSVAEDKDLLECKKNNFSDCLMGMKWGEDISEGILSRKGCSTLSGVEEDTRKWRTPDWCETLQLSEKPPMVDSCPGCQGFKICNKKTFPDGVEYCYRGRNYLGNSNRDYPSMLSALWVLQFEFMENEKNAPEEDKEKITLGKTISNNYGFGLFPVSYGEETKAPTGGRIPSSVRFLIAYHDKIVGFATQGTVPEKIDPKYFLIKASEKYGKPTKEFAFKDKPLGGRYSHCSTWDGKNDKIAQVTCIVSPSLSYTGLGTVDNIFIEKATFEKVLNSVMAQEEQKILDKKKEEKGKTKKGADHVDF